MSKAVVNRGDLLRALLHHDGVLPPGLDAVLGFSRIPEAEPDPQGGNTSEDEDIDTGPGGDKPPPPDSSAPPAEIPFWQPVSLEMDEIAPLDSSLRSVVEQLPQRESLPPPQYRFLAPIAELIPRLRAALSVRRPSNAYDVPRIAASIGRGELLQRLPRRHRVGWGSSLYVIEDRCDHLAPYVLDQAMVQDQLQRFFPLQGYYPSIYSELNDWPQVCWPDGRVTAIELLPGDQVLVLGDLGCLARDGGRSVDFWGRFAHHIDRVGATALALLPCSPVECPSELARHYQLLSWEHPTPPAVSPQELSRLGEHLLGHLAIASRIEPGLLREIRIALGADRYPARMEAWVWQHPEMDEPDMVATALQTDKVEIHASYFERDIDCRHKTARAVKGWMRHLPYELWLDTLLLLGDWADEKDQVSGEEAVVSQCERDDARKLLNYLACRMEPHQGSGLSARSWDWVQGLMGRLGERGMRDPVTKQACWAINKALKHRHTGPPPPPTEVRCYGLYHQGAQLAFYPAGTVPIVLGSPVALLNSRDGAVQIAVSSFWQAARAPDWATDWGHDAHGPWIEFVYQKVRQRLRWIPPGELQMGSPEDERGRYDDEGPQHSVILGQGYWLFDTPVTQALWQAVTGDNPSEFKSLTRPVENISWDDCHGFIEQINRLIPDLALCLPSEAQWEYACRASERAAIYTGPLNVDENGQSSGLDAIAWYNKNSGQDFELGGEERARDRGTHPVALKLPNSWGLYDMLGNVLEWTADPWHDDYQEAPTDGSVWEDADADAGADRVVRGGSWDGKARYCRSAFRDRYGSDDRVDFLGFRLARVQGGAEPESALSYQAERRSSAGSSGVAERLNLHTQRQTTIELPVDVVSVIIRSDRNLLRLHRRSQPRWASAMGRDTFGLWAEIDLGEGLDRTLIQRLRWIAPGEFQMGSPKGELERRDVEGPQDLVTLEQGYWLFDTPVTQALWQAVTGDNPSDFKSLTRPVENVSWDDCQGFIEQINRLIPELALCLPSESQWEYACRADQQAAIYTGPLDIDENDQSSALDAIAWYSENSDQDFELEGENRSIGKGTHPVALKLPNPWGLYDMLGNVWEWTADPWHDDYQEAPVDGSVWDDTVAGAFRVVRGGSWSNGARFCRSASRSRNGTDGRIGLLGFRLARVQP